MGVWRWGKRESIYTYRYIVTTRMTCIKMGSDESHFNVSLIVRDKVTRPYPQTTTFEEVSQGFLKVLLSFWPLGARKRSYIRTRHSL